MRLLLLLLPLAACLVACKPRIPSGVIPPSEMEQILYDYHLSQAMARHTGNPAESDYNQTLYLLAALEKNGVTRADFDSSLVYYYRRAERFSAIYKRVAERLTDEAQEYGASAGELGQFSRLSATGDTADVWNGNKGYVLLPYYPHNRVDFALKADTSFYAGDQFLLRLMSDYVWQEGTKEATLCLVARFTNDSVVTQHTRLTTSGLSQLRLYPGPDDLVKELRGFIYLHNSAPKSQSFRLLLLNNIQLVRMHRPKPVEVK